MLAIIIILLIIILSPVILIAGFFILEGIVLLTVFIVCLITVAADKISDFIYEVAERCKKQINKK